VKTTVIILNPSDLKIRGKQDRKAYNIFIQLFKDYQFYIDQQRKQVVDEHAFFESTKQYEMPSIDYILSEHPKLRVISDDVFNHDEYLSEKDIIEGTLKHFKRMESFANHNYWKTENNILNLKEFNQPNVYLIHPWDQDLNRIKYQKNIGVMQERGEKANYLYQLPVSKSVIKFSKDLLYKISTECFKVIKKEQKRDFAFQDLLDIVEVQTYCQPELKELKEILMMKAFLATEANRNSIETIASDMTSSPKLIYADLYLKAQKILSKITSKIGRKVKVTKAGGIKTDGFGYIIEKSKIKLSLKIKELKKSLKLARKYKGLTHSTSELYYNILKKKYGEQIEKDGFSLATGWDEDEEGFEKKMKLSI